MQDWRALPDPYDDGGFSGSNMERPGLQRLLADMDTGKVDVIVVYKIDRLSRSLLDFMKMIERFNEKGISFVSVTQHFNTTDPTGRMFLSILITFAQYEREVIAERIRDKVAAAKRRGKYCGGPAILGYDVDRERKKLLVNPAEAPLVQHIFQRFTQLASAKSLAAELNEQGYRTKSWTTKKGKHRSGSPWNTGHIYRLLGNRLYRGEVVHKGKVYPGEHEAIVSKGLWSRVQEVLSENTRAKQTKAKTKIISPLEGVLRCGHCDGAMGLTYTQKGPRHYTYYHCARDAKRAVSRCPLKRVPAGDIEKVVLEQLSAVFRTPTLVSQTYFAAKGMEGAERERLLKHKEQLEDDLLEVRQRALEEVSPDGNGSGPGIDIGRAQSGGSDPESPANGRLSPSPGVRVRFRSRNGKSRKPSRAWRPFGMTCFPWSANRLIRLLVEKVELRETGIDMELKTQGMTSLIIELSSLGQ